MTKKKPEDWITQTEAARLKGMTLAAINELVRRARVRSTELYGKRLVSRADIEAFEPKPKKQSARKSTKKARK